MDVYHSSDFDELEAIRLGQTDVVTKVVQAPETREVEASAVQVETA